MSEFEELKNNIDNYVEGLDLAKRTKNDYRLILNDYFKFVINQKYAPTRQTILDYKASLDKRNFKAASIQKYMVCIRGFYTYLNATDKGKNLALGIKGKKVESTFKKEALTLNQAKALIRRAKLLATRKYRKIQDLRNYAIVLLLLTTGLRTIEVSRADINDISDNGKIIKLYIQGKGRDDKDAFVKVEPNTLDAISSYLVARGNDGYEALFLTHNYNRKTSDPRITAPDISVVVKKLLRDVGIDSKKVSAHSLRHTNAMLSKNELHKNTDAIQRQLRHKDPKVTMIYAEMDYREDSTIEAEIGGLLIPKSK